LRLWWLLLAAGSAPASAPMTSSVAAIVKPAVPSVSPIVSVVSVVSVALALAAATPASALHLCRAAVPATRP